MEVDAAPARDADQADSELSDPTTTDTAARTGRRSALLVVVAVLLAVVLVAAIVIAVLRGRQVHAQDELAANRDAALRAAEQFALRMDAFDGADLTAYTKSVEPLLTDKEKTVFSQQLQQFQQLYDQVQKASKAKNAPEPGTGAIVMAGVSDVDADSATVLVAHDSTIPGTSQKLHSRWTISMRQIDGRWLVDSFTPVA